MAGSQQRVTGHVSLKQTAHLRTHADVPAFLRSSAVKEPQNSTFVPFHQRSSSENGANYVPYSPYAFRRRDVTARPFSPPLTKDPEVIVQQPFSPFRQESKVAEQTCHLPFGKVTDSGAGRFMANGQGRPFSPYRQDSNLIEAGNRPYSPFPVRSEEREGSRERGQGISRSLSPFARDYSPWRRENVDPPGVVQPPNETGRYSPFVQRRLGQPTPPPPAPQTHPQTHDPYGSPLVSRKRFPSEPPPQGTHGSSSPHLISRFAHQLKQEPQPALSSQAQGGAKESAKKRFASYVRLRLGGERAPSPDPPPRLSRGESPLALRRNFVDQPSPSLPRRYVSPSPPQPPPRRLSESSSVPGSPQHVRARLRYTPEPQRRPPPP